MTSKSGPGARPSVLVILLGGLLAVTGLLLLLGGGYLVVLGGSAYYALAGIAMLVSGILVGRGRAAGAVIFAVVFLGTVAWAIWEVGLQFWPLVPRIAPMLVMAFVMFLLLPRLTGGRSRGSAFVGAGVTALCLVWGLVAAFLPQGVIRPAAAVNGINVASSVANAEQDWTYFGRTPAGTRFAPFEQITPDNVSRLEVAFTVRTGDVTEPGIESQNTPLQVGDKLFTCTPRNQVLALDADTGSEIWRFNPKVKVAGYSRCRGVGYHDASASSSSPGTAMDSSDHSCVQRIILTTVNAQMFALDAATGEPCESFGENGMVDLRKQIGGGNPAFYFQTSAPTVARNMVIVGSFVMDGRAETMQGGVIRAFDVITGDILWAFDPGNPRADKLPPPGQSFVQSTANMWSTPAFDDELGMIYLPMGGASDDFWGANRSEETKRYTTTILALDIATGRERWHFQTVHYDKWDYDNASQPALIDVPDGKGGTVPAVLQPTKTGQLFLLDRRTGIPIANVEERPVPQSGQEGDWTAPTQPVSVGMPQIGTEPLTEASMWGGTFFDQLYCRIRFRQARYQGPYTPITTQPTIIYPGYYGGMNWGGVSVDEDKGILVVNDIRMPQVVSLVPQDQVPAGAGADAHSLGLYPQKGGPYATRHETLMSFLGVPCNAPPWGTLTGVDLQSRKILWQRPAGTVKDSVLPIGMKFHLPIPLGMPTLGGPISTASGLTFYTGTQDYYLRALDTKTGEELWKARLPVGTQSTPMTYVSPKTGRQYVIVTAGGARLSPDHGDYVIAYALRDGH